MTTNEFSDLVRQFYSRAVDYAQVCILRNNLRDLEGTDLASEAFAYIWLHKDSLDARQVNMAYITTTIRNDIGDIVYHRGVRQKNKPSVLDLYPPAPAPDIEDKALALLIQATVESLPPRQREVIRLRWFEHKSRAEIARILNTNQNGIEQTMTRAMNKLRACAPQLKRAAGW